MGKLLHDDDDLTPGREPVPSAGILAALEGRKAPRKVIYHSGRGEFFLVGDGTPEPPEDGVARIEYAIIARFEGNQEGHDLVKRAATSEEMQDALHGQGKRIRALLDGHPDLAPDVLATLGDVARTLLETSELPDGVSVSQAGD